MLNGCGMVDARAVRSMLTGLFLCMVMHGQEITIRADVTGDGVYDDVKIGENYVLLVDKMSCCKRTKRFVVDECDSLVDVTVDDYHRGIYGKEIAVMQSGEHGLFTDIYACVNSRIAQIAFALPGRVVRDERGMVFCHEGYTSDSMKMTIPCAVQTADLLLEKMPVTGERDTSFVLEPASMRRLSYHISPGSYVILCAVSDHPDVDFILQDGSGEPVEVERRNGQMSAIIHAGHLQDIELVIEHADAQESAQIYCVMRRYSMDE